MVKLMSEQMRSEGIRSEHGGRSMEIHGCYRRPLLYDTLPRVNNEIFKTKQVSSGIRVRMLKVGDFSKVS